ncbi:HAUS augmin-like complex subunit 8 [Oxyura jamaicensis]|uniref:HAUS augmin-like complex subunit 8 n=1 Tax=Oxyura jamaicensis TaxID=8884 RepID=UPI0015A6B45D|nr:HAUS augmin-like complex subunit 8 [Oxyura jamaicensis]
MSSQGNSSRAAVADGEESEKKRKGGRIVKSRYLQYEKKEPKKDTTASSFSKSTSNASSAVKPKSVPTPQKCKTSAGVASGSLNQSCFEKSDLQSTLLDGDKITRPDLDLSAINEKTTLKKTPGSKSSCKKDTGTHGKKQKSKCDPDVLMEVLGSQTLILTYLRVKAGEDVAELEKKAEENLLMLCEEKEREQEKLYELKREVLLKEREQRLEEALDKQMEVLSPLVSILGRFKEQYKSFAASLDATRHELPMRNIHIEGDRPTYLDEMQKQLTITQELLAEVMPSYSEESAKTCSVLKDVKDVSQELDKELQRSFAQVQNLSYEVSKEISLHNQSICEDNYGLDVVKHWYFN